LHRDVLSEWATFGTRKKKKEAERKSITNIFANLSESLEGKSQSASELLKEKPGHIPTREVTGRKLEGVKRVWLGQITEGQGTRGRGKER